MPTLLLDSQLVSEVYHYSGNHSALHPFHSHISSLLLSSFVLSSHTSHPSHCNVMRLKENQADAATKQSLRILESHLLFLFLHCIGGPCTLDSTGPHHRCHCCCCCCCCCCCWCCSFAYLGSSGSGRGSGRGSGGWLCCPC